MKEKNNLGRTGERIAVEHLQSLGYRILHTNWHFLHLELDIVAQDGDELVIVEVKARGSEQYEHPSEAISKRKIRFLVDAAEAYIFKYDLHFDTRFDVITIIFYANDQYKLEHFKNAFGPPIN